MPEATSLPSPRRIFWAVLTGTLLFQMGWVLALPAFRGADEFDHAYKADAVAHGLLRGTVDAEDGRGQLLEVDADLVAAAGPLCSSYDYTGPDNCRVVEDVGDGRVLVASAAASYNPAFYAVVGTVARPFDGVAALMGMRVTTAVLTGVLLAGAAAVTVRWSRTRWPLLALVVACTPVLMQSGGVAAPNAVGFAAGTLVWAAAAGVVSRPELKGWSVPLAVGSVALLVTHTTGLLWGACIAVVVTCLRPSREWWALARANTRPVVAFVGTVGMVATACLAWILTADTNELSAPKAGLPPIQGHDLALSQVLWGLQTVAAFPMRNEMAPLWVYPMWTIALGVLVWNGMRAADQRTRAATGTLVLAWLVVPLTLTLVSYASEGYAWQGRYALPLAVGLPALAGLALDRTGVGPRRQLAVLTLLLVAVSHLSSVVHVALRERVADFPGTFVLAVPGGVGVGTAVVVLLALAGMAVCALGAVDPARRPQTRTTASDSSVSSAPREVLR